MNARNARRRSCPCTVPVCACRRRRQSRCSLLFAKHAKQTQELVAHVPGNDDVAPFSTSSCIKDGPLPSSSLSSDRWNGSIDRGLCELALTSIMQGAVTRYASSTESKFLHSHSVRVCHDRKFSSFAESGEEFHLKQRLVYCCVFADRYVVYAIKTAVYSL